MEMGSQEYATVPHLLLDGLDRTKFDELCRSTEERRQHKLSYGDLDLWLERAWREATRLGLNHSPPLDILDIGMGPGYSLYVCQRLGHRCVGLDRPGLFPFWQSLRKFLGIQKVVEHAIKPYEPLPSDIGRFDLVTSYRAQFNSTKQRLWNLDEWAFFLDDLRDNVLKPGGRFALKLAKQEHKGHAGGLKRNDDTLLRLMVDRGASAHGSLLIFAPLR